MPEFIIVKSPTAKTECRCGCNEKIAKGEPRLDVNMGSGYFEVHFKPEHFARIYHHQIKQLFKLVCEIEDARERNRKQGEQAQSKEKLWDESELRKVKSKFIVTTPYEKGCEEYNNCKGNLEDFSGINDNELGIIECDECVECGAINDTVREIEVFEDEEMIKLKLCDYCARSYEG